jgi:hypothetical protein
MKDEGQRPAFQIDKPTGLTIGGNDSMFCTLNLGSGWSLETVELWGKRNVRRPSCRLDRAFEGIVSQSQPISGKSRTL